MPGEYRFRSQLWSPNSQGDLGGRRHSHRTLTAPGQTGTFCTLGPPLTGVSSMLHSPFYLNTQPSARLTEDSLCVPADIPNILAAFRQRTCMVQRSETHPDLMYVLTAWLLVHGTEGKGSRWGSTEYNCISQEAAFWSCQPPPTPLPMSAGMVTWQGKWQGKEQSRGLSILFFFTPAAGGQMCVHQCWWGTKAGMQSAEMGICRGSPSLQAWPPGAHLSAQCPRPVACPFASSTASEHQ